MRKNQMKYLSKNKIGLISGGLLDCFCTKNPAMVLNLGHMQTSIGLLLPSTNTPNSVLRLGIDPQGATKNGMTPEQFCEHCCKKQGYDKGTLNMASYYIVDIDLQKK